VGVPIVATPWQNAGSSNVNIFWNPVSGAAKYAVYRIVNGGWTNLGGNFTENQIVDSAAPAGSVSYAVYAIDAAGNWSGYVTKNITVR
jgi:hypothetical protein